MGGTSGCPEQCTPAQLTVTTTEATVVAAVMDEEGGDPDPAQDPVLDPLAAAAGGPDHAASHVITNAGPGLAPDLGMVPPGPQSTPGLGPDPSPDRNQDLDLVPVKIPGPSLDPSPSPRTDLSPSPGPSPGLSPNPAQSPGPSQSLSLDPSLDQSPDRGQIKRNAAILDRSDTRGHNQLKCSVRPAQIIISVWPV